MAQTTSKTTTLDRPVSTDAEAEQLLVSALRGKRGALTRADAVALTGLPTDRTESALRSLLRTYKSHLAVTEQGELVYQFDPAMVRRDALTLGERLAEVGRLLWRGFTFLFKIWIVATLVFYVVAFIAMLLAMVFVRTSGDRDDRRRDDGFGFPWLLYWMMPDWAPPDVRRRLPAKRNKRFYQSAFDYVFGPKGAPADPLRAEREFVAYLRSTGARISATDLVALTGWSYDRADQEATRLLAAYDGEPEVTEDGTLVYSFPELRRTTGEEADQPWRFAWQKRDALAPLTGNTTGTNTAITAMNGFNLFAAFVIGPAFLMRFGIASSAADMAITWFPLAFSALFFAIPAGRLGRRRRQMIRFERARARAAVLGEIMARRGEAATPEALVAHASAASGIAPAEIRRALDGLLVDLDGEPQNDAEGRVVYAFPRVRTETQATDSARALAPAAEREIGAVVFSSDEEGQGAKPRVH